MWTIPLIDAEIFSKSLEKIAELTSQKLTEKQKEDEDEPKKIKIKDKNKLLKLQKEVELQSKLNGEEG